MLSNWIAFKWNTIGLVISALAAVFGIGPNTGHFANRRYIFPQEQRRVWWYRADVRSCSLSRARGGEGAEFRGGGVWIIKNLSRYWFDLFILSRRNLIIIEQHSMMSPSAFNSYCGSLSSLPLVLLRGRAVRGCLHHQTPWLPSVILEHAFRASFQCATSRLSGQKHKKYWCILLTGQSCNYTSQVSEITWL